MFIALLLAMALMLLAGCSMLVVGAWASHAGAVEPGLREVHWEEGEEDRPALMTVSTEHAVELADSAHRPPQSHESDRRRDLLGFTWQLGTKCVAEFFPDGGGRRPQPALEDSQALWHVLSFLSAAIDRKDSSRQILAPDARDWSHSPHNLVVVGSSQRNPLTRLVLEHPNVSQLVDVRFAPRTPVMGEPPRAGSLWIGGEEYESPSFQQEAQHVGDDRYVNLADVALIALVPNPWHPMARSLVLAGVRGFGTQGAGQLLECEWAALLEQSDGQLFYCVVDVTCRFDRKTNNPVSVQPTARPVVRLPEPTEWQGPEPLPRPGREA